MTTSMATVRQVSRETGAVAAAVVAILIAVVATALKQSEFVWIGLPVATVAGACLGPNLDTSKLWPDRPVLQMSFLCTVFAAVGVALVISPDSPLGVAGFGLAVLGVPAFIFLSIPSLMWASLAVWLTRRRSGARPTATR